MQDTVANDYVCFHLESELLGDKNLHWLVRHLWIEVNHLTIIVPAFHQIAAAPEEVFAVPCFVVIFKLVLKLSKVLIIASRFFL